jgi:glutamyl-tRNA reductase
MPHRHDLQVLSWQHGADATRAFDAIDPDAAQQVRAALAAAGIPSVVLATCHRFEIYWAGASSQAVRVREVAQHIVQERLPLLADLHGGDRGLEHAMTVASGMRSLRRGEPEILGQVRLAWRGSQDAGTSSPNLDHLMQRVIAASRHIRRHLGETAQWSIGDATVRLLQCELAGPHLAHRPSLLIVGAGAVGASVADAVARARRDGRLDRVQSVAVTNRTADRANELAARCHAHPVDWAEWHDALCRADLVVTTARSASPLIDRALALHIASVRQGGAVWIDLASPRNIAPDAAVAGCQLMTLRDLPQNDDFADAAAQQALRDELARLRDERQRRERQMADGLQASSHSALQAAG